MSQGLYRLDCPFRNRRRTGRCEEAAIYDRAAQVRGVRRPAAPAARGATEPRARRFAGARAVRRVFAPSKVVTELRRDVGTGVRGDAREDVVVLAPKDVARVLRTATKWYSDHELAIRMLFYTGMRGDEMLGLQWEDVERAFSRSSFRRGIWSTYDAPLRSGSIA